MFQVSGRLTELALQHRHNDGSWSDLQRSHHDPADHDPERDWVSGEIFVCAQCGEEVRVTHGGPLPVDGDTT